MSETEPGRGETGGQPPRAHIAFRELTRGWRIMLVAEWTLIGASFFFLAMVAIGMSSPALGPPEDYLNNSQKLQKQIYWFGLQRLPIALVLVTLLEIANRTPPAVKGIFGSTLIFVRCLWWLVAIELLVLVSLPVF